MSWATELCAVYEKASNPKFEGKYGEPPLPIYHSTTSAQVEVEIDGSGNFSGAGPVKSDSDSVTVIPVTENSAAKVNGICPHPFADKLIYLAGDYAKYCHTKKDDEEKYKKYIEQLKRWCDSEYTHPSVNLLYEYLSKGTLISDLVRARVFTVDDSGRLTSDKILKTTQSDVFIRFIIYGDSDEENTWKDKTLQDSFIKYNSSLQGEKSLSYADGKIDYCTYKHPTKILNAGDKGKLFSANDDTGFSYRGRFENKKQAFSIGYDFSQKMHNGLKWLIARQKVSYDGLTLIAWDSELKKLPNFCGDSENISDDKTEEDFYPKDFKSYQYELTKSIFGSEYKKNLDSQRVMVMALDEATTGRVSINMYSEMYESEFRNNIQKWHTDTAWNRYSSVEKKEFVGSFSLYQIVNYTYGTEQGEKVDCDKKIRKTAVLRLIPCITEGRKLPEDIVRQLVNRTSRRSSYKKSWETLLAVTCGMIRKKLIEERKNTEMEHDKDLLGLDKGCKDINYLFGRFLGWAEVAERASYGESESHPTNAERLFERYASFPVSTMELLNRRLQPYMRRMSAGQKRFYEMELDDINQKISVAKFDKNIRLEPLYLLGFSHERYHLSNRGKNNGNKNNEDEKSGEE